MMDDADATLQVPPPTPSASLADASVELSDSCVAGILAAGQSPGSPSHASTRWQPPGTDALQRQMPGYVIHALIGRGGMGAVYRATQRSLQREVAIKVLPPDISEGDAQFTERFRQEAHAMARLSHGGIVAVHDFGETGDGMLFFVMEFVEGSDLADLIRKHGRIDPRRSLDIIGQISDALAFAHENGIIHRDIKPSNIMIDRHGRVKVTDFGLAKILHIHDGAGITQSAVAMGTPDYMAPESFTSGAAYLDRRADIYAVGVMLYQMLTGELPRGRFVLPSKKVRGLPQLLDNIVDRALQSDREQRYSTVAELKTDLKQVMDAGSPQSKGRTWVVPAVAVAALVIALLNVKLPLNPANGWHEESQSADASEAVPPDAAASRRAAELVLQKGGIVIVIANGQRLRLVKGQSLPSETLYLKTAEINATKGRVRLFAEEMETIAAAREIKELLLPGIEPQMTDRFMKAVGSLHALQRFTTSGSLIPSDLMHHLAGLERLATLYIPGSGITDTGLAAISHLPEIREVDFDDTFVTGAGIAKMKAAPTLLGVKLGQREREITQDARAVIAACPSLTLLHLYGQMKPEAFEQLTSLKDLRLLSFGSTIFDAPLLAALEKAAAPSDLKLVQCKIKDWSAFARLQHLRLLSITTLSWDPGVADALRQMPHLAVIELIDFTKAHAPELQTALPGRNIVTRP